LWILEFNVKEEWNAISVDDQRHVILALSKEVCRHSNQISEIKLLCFGLLVTNFTYELNELPHRQRFSTLWAEFVIQNSYIKSYKDFQIDCLKAIYKIFAIFLLCHHSEEVLEYLRELAKRDHFIDVNLNSSSVSHTTLFIITLLILYRGTAKLWHFINYPSR
jgi:hypothetical protein